MPYYVFAMRPFTPPERLGEYAAFKDASAMAKAERAARGPDSSERIRVMFAADAQAAEDLLFAQRDPNPPGDE
jgi:hypothetical protein